MAWGEIKTASTRIWTGVDELISPDDNRVTKFKIIIAQISNWKTSWWCNYRVMNRLLCLGHFLWYKGQAVKYTLTASLQKSKVPSNKCPWYNTKSSDGEAPVLERWRMLCISPFPLLPGPLLTRVVIPKRVLSLDQIELFNNLLDLKPSMSNRITSVK